MLLTKLKTSVLRDCTNSWLELSNVIRLHGCLPILIALAACGPAASETTVSSSDNAGSSPDVGTANSPPTTSTTSTSDATVSDGTANGTTMATQAGETVTDQLPEDCDLLKQDCPAGQKCSFFSDDIQKIRPVPVCVPIAPDPQLPDQLCHFNEPGVGIDDCVLGSFCLPFNSDGAGTSSCVELCAEEKPNCSDNIHNCVLLDDSPLTWCNFTCHVLLQNCADGLACSLDQCLPLSPGFFDRQPGMPCQTFNQCVPKSICGFAKYVQDCSDDLCCTEVCDLKMPFSCALPGQSCEPATDGLEDYLPEGVGVCQIV